MAKLIENFRELHEDGEKRVLEIFDPGSSRRATENPSIDDALRDFSLDTAQGVVIPGESSFWD